MLCVNVSVYVSMLAPVATQPTPMIVYHGRNYLATTGCGHAWHACHTPNATSSYASAPFTGACQAWTLGAFIGPLLGAALTQLLGFRRASSALGVALVLAPLPMLMLPVRARARNAWGGARRRGRAMLLEEALMRNVAAVVWLAEGEDPPLPPPLESFSKPRADQLHMQRPPRLDHAGTLT